MKIAEWLILGYCCLFIKFYIVCMHVRVYSNCMNDSTIQRLHLYFCVFDDSEKSILYDECKRLKKILQDEN